MFKFKNKKPSLNIYNLNVSSRILEKQTLQNTHLLRYNHGIYLLKIKHSCYSYNIFYGILFYGKNMKNIVLIGFMGSGKSTIAKRLSAILQWSWVDSDEYIAYQQKCSIKQIFQEYGESHCRKLESEFIESFIQKKHYIIATGGGMPIFNDITHLGVRFYLKSDFFTITQRIKLAQQDDNNTRPLFDDIQQAHALYKKREPLYKSQSDFTINANTDEDGVARAIIDIITNHYKVKIINA